MSQNDAEQLKSPSGNTDEEFQPAADGQTYRVVSTPSPNSNVPTRSLQSVDGIATIDEVSYQRLRYLHLQRVHKQILTDFAHDPEKYSTQFIDEGMEAKISVVKSDPPVIVKKLTDPYGIENKYGRKIVDLIEEGPTLFPPINAALQEINCNVAWPTAYVMDQFERVIMIATEPMIGITLKDLLQNVDALGIQKEQLLSLALQFVKAMQILRIYDVFSFDIGTKNTIYDPKTGKLNFIDVDGSFQTRSGDKILTTLAYNEHFLHPELKTQVDANRRKSKDSIYYDIEERHIIYSMQRIVQAILTPRDPALAEGFAQESFETVADLIASLERLNASIA